MKYLGIDYGESKVGFAVGNDSLAMPLEVFYYKNVKQLIEKIKVIIFDEKSEQVIVGISEAKTAEKTKNFMEILQKEIDIPVILSDETLSTIDAQVFAIEAGIKHKKRKQMEDAYAATLILQSYLDNK